MQHQTVQVVRLQIRQRHSQRLPHLVLQTLLGVVGDVVGVLSVDGGELALDEQLFSTDSGLLDALSDCWFVVVFGLAGSVDGPEASLDGESDEMSCMLFFPGSAVEHGRVLLHCSLLHLSIYLWIGDGASVVSRPNKIEKWDGDNVV